MVNCKFNLNKHGTPVNPINITSSSNTSSKASETTSAGKFYRVRELASQIEGRRLNCLFKAFTLITGVAKMKMNILIKEMKINYGVF